MKVLYVEDSEMDADLTRRALSRSIPGLELVVSPSLADAFARLQASPGFDVILSDLRLPDGLGLDLLAHVRQRDPDVPFVILTGLGDQETAIAALRAGADEYVLKEGKYLERLPGLLDEVSAGARGRRWRLGRPLRVLYCERSQADVDLTRRYLESKAPHISVDVACSPEDVLELVPEGATGPPPFDVLLLDYRQNGVDGLELVRILRERGVRAPVVIVTGHGSPEVAARALHLGVADYLVKGSGYLEALPFAIERAFQQAELERQHADLASLKARLDRILTAGASIVYTLRADVARLPATWVSDNITRILGYTPEQAIEPGFWSANLHAEDRERAEEDDRKILTEGRLVRDFRFRHADGRYLWFHDEAVLLRDAAGRPVEVVGTWVDVTERVLGEEQRLLQSAALAAAANAIVITDREGRVEWANPAFSTSSGYDLAEVIGRRLGDFVRAGSHDHALHEEIRATVLAGNVWHSEIESQRKDGGTYQEDLTITPVRDPDGVSRHFVAVKQDITERKRAEATLRQSEARFRRMFDEAAVGAAIVSLDFRFVRVNRALTEITGYTSEELLARTFVDITHPDDAGTDVDQAQSLAAGRIDHYEVEKRYIRKDGGQAWVRLYVRLMRDEDGEPLYFLPLMMDVTERKSLEAQLLQSQKMEAIGVLAGGVAHDFNNMLAVIRGFADLAMEKAAPDDPIQSDLREIQAAARRSADLTRQLLSFARKQAASPRILDLNAALASLTSMLSRLIGEDVELRVVPGAGLWTVRVDPAQLDQILTNLLTNARDAIAGVGTITIETANVRLPGGNGSFGADVPPGEYVLLSVSDTGSGMDGATQGRIFEPFFTTKGDGKGSGLGLSMVYGIVKQNGGGIVVTSRSGAGSTFRIFLPRSLDASGDRAGAHPEGSQRVRGHETVLVVEDEPALLRLVRLGLTQRGFNVLPAASVGEALALAERPTVEIDALVTDVVMPSMNGVQLEERIRELRPAIRTLFMSGYTSNVVAERGLLPETVRFIQKPFTLDGLAARLREALDG